MIVTIDGPAGAGKSTVARALAKRLGFRYLDTGAMYRAVALAGLRRGLDWNRPELLVDLARQVNLEVRGERILLDGEDVTEMVRTSEVTAVTRFSANNPDVRRHLVDLQRAAAVGCDLVTEGRDQGTVVFPHAECKIYLTASPEERARRRVHELQGRGESPSFEDVLAKLIARDEQDASRDVGPMRAAADAILFPTDNLSPGEVIAGLAALVERRRGKLQTGEAS